MSGCGQGVWQCSVITMVLFLQSQQSELLDLLGGDITSTAPVLTSEAPPTATPSGGGALLDLLGLDVGASTSAPPPSSSVGLMDLLGGVLTSTPAAPAPTSEPNTIFLDESSQVPRFKY